LGTLAALHAGGPIDHGAMLFAMLGVSMPRFWIGPLLIMLFSIRFDLLPVSGREGFASLVLPAFTLGTALAAMLSRMVRTSLLEVIEADFITAVRAKGAPEYLVIGKHAMKNALVPVITVLGLQFGALLSGAVVTEMIFSWPGIGRLLIQAIETRDYRLVQGCVLVIAFCYVFVNLLTDLCYAAVDPRVRFE
ncbi:MAG: ABC transporter permease, partial [Deltaproteobacteria bacterium]